MSGQAAGTTFPSHPKPGLARWASHGEEEIESIPGNSQGPDQGGKDEGDLQPVVRKFVGDEDDNAKGPKCENSIPFCEELLPRRQAGDLRRVVNAGYALIRAGYL
jgi:hypothetical protein